jgi:4-amino-4-deoxy-L-arabinose transferase-like glycosyltransferase
MTWLVPVQIAISVLSIWILYHLTLAIGGSHTQGLLAALMMAVYPPFIGYAVTPSPVTLETLFLLSGTLFIVQAQHESSPWHAIAAGFSFGLAALTRSPWLIAVPIVMAWLFWMSQERGWQRVKIPLLVGMATVIVLVPWAVHNFQTHREWFVTGTNGGLNFWIGNNTAATGEYIFPTQIDRDLILDVASWPERERDRFFYLEGLQFIQQHPRQWLQLAAKKLQYFFLFRPSMGSSYESANLQLDLARTLFKAAWLMLLPLGLLGLLLRRQQWKHHLLFLVIIISQAVVAMLYFTGTRFRIPLETFVMIWAAGFLIWVYRKVLPGGRQGNPLA